MGTPTTIRLLLPILPLLLCVAPAAAQTDKFDNWYFKFFEGRTQSEGEARTAAGELFETGAGRLVVTVDRGAGTARLQSELKLAASGELLASESLLRVAGEGEFVGYGVDDEGNRTETTLRVSGGGRYTSTVSSELVTVAAEGALAEDGESVVVTETVRDAEGEVIATVKITYRKAAAPAAP